MQVVLPFTYALIFIFLILKLKFFDFTGISKGQLILLFVLKIVFGFAVSAIYMFYYNTSDFDTYLKASKMGFDYFMGNSSNLIMPGWNSSFDDTMFNNSRIVIGINFLLQFISLNIQFVHILFFCFFSFAGLTALFRSLYKHFPNKRIALVIGIYLVPSVLFWTAGVFKETIAISCLGFLVYFTDFGLQKKYTSSQILLSIFLFILLFFTKIYIALAISPLLLANFMISKTEGKYIVLKYLSVFIAAVLMVHGFSKFGDKTNVYKMFADKQSKAISEAKGGYFLMNDSCFISVESSNKNTLILQQDSTYRIKMGSSFLSWKLDNMKDTTFVVNSMDSSSFKLLYHVTPANSVVLIKPFPPTFGGILNNIPSAILNVFIQPTLFGIKNSWQLIAWLENSLVILLLVFAVLFFDKKIAKDNEVLLFCLLLGIIQFAEIGLVTPAIGAMVRYKVTALPFIVTISLICIDSKKLFSVMKRIKN